MFQTFSKANMQQAWKEYRFILFTLPILGCLLETVIVAEIFYGGQIPNFPIVLFCYLSSLAIIFLLSLHSIVDSSLFKLSNIDEFMMLNLFASVILSPLFYVVADVLVQAEDVATGTNFVAFIAEVLIVLLFLVLTNILFMLFSPYFIQKELGKPVKKRNASSEERKQTASFHDPLRKVLDEKVAYLRKLPLTGRESQDMDRVLQLVDDSIQTYQKMYAPEAVHLQALHQNLQHAHAFLDELIAKQNAQYVSELRKNEEKLKAYNRTIKHT